MTKKKSNPKKGKTEKMNELIVEAKDSQWVRVDTENIFTFMEANFKISDTNEKYTVFNKPSKDDDSDWTNDSLMEKVLCIDDGDILRFFDEDLKEITNEVFEEVIRVY